MNFTDFSSLSLNLSASLDVLNLLLKATVPVQIVVLLLALASLYSWYLIFRKRIALHRAARNAEYFEDEFWRRRDLPRMYARVSDEQYLASGLEAIFEAGYTEFVRLRKQTGTEPMEILHGAQRAMRVALERELDELEHHLAALASVGSVSPYVGLFGTVWGIMHAFHGLAGVQQATLQMVAPGISEALIATALGLFAAIPAVLAYNAFSAQIDRLSVRYGTFLDEFSGILHRQARARQEAPAGTAPGL